jgi:hypothetical protein
MKFVLHTDKKVFTNLGVFIIINTAFSKGKTQTLEVKYCNLDAILSVGYRVNSNKATQFRIWATQILKEYIIKGFTKFAAPYWVICYLHVYQ